MEKNTVPSRGERPGSGDLPSPAELVDSFRSDDGSARFEAFTALNEYGSKALPAIREGLKHGNWQVRRWCAIFLDHHSDEKSLQSLVPLLRDAKRQVRLWASAKVGGPAGSKIAMGASAVTAPRGDRRWPRAGSR